MPTYGTRIGAGRKVAIARDATAHAAEEPAIRGKAAVAWGLARIGLGLVFLWAFLDKTFGLGFATSADKAWINGGSPTAGFLGFGTSGPFAGFYQSIAGNVFVDALFMVGLLGIGLALVLGMGVRIAGWSGALMMLLMYTARLPFTAEGATNPLVDSHVVYGLVLIGFALGGAGKVLGLGGWWSRQAVVRRYPILK